MRLFRHAGVIAAIALVTFACDSNQLTNTQLSPSYSANANGLHLRDTDANANVPADTTVSLNDTIHMSLAAGNGNGPQNNKNVQWTTSNAAVVSITPAQGSVTAVAHTIGTATVTATSGNNSVSVVIHVSAGAGDHYVVTVSSTTPAAGSTISVSAQLVDAANNPVPEAGRIVTWTSTNGGSFLPPSSTTDANGIASTSFLTSTVAGTTHILTATDNFSLTGSSAPVTTQTGPATNMTAYAGQGQSATVGTAVAVPPAVRVTDTFGNPVAGIAVNFAVTGGGGSVTAPNATTDANGVAAVGSWTMGSTPGPNTLDATSTGLTTVTFTAVATTGTATQLAMVMQPSASAQAGVAFAQQPSVQIKDALNNNVAQAGVVVTASIATGAGTLAGTLTASTDASGLATFTDLRIDGATGTRTLRFASSGLADAISDPVNVGAGPADHLTVTTQPSSNAQAGVAFAQQPTIQLQDAFNNNVAQSGVSVTAAIASGGGTLLGTTSVNTDGTGAAAFSDLAIGGTVGTRTLSFNASGVTGATSDPINVGFGPAYDIALSTPDSTVLTNSTITITGQVRDAYANAVAQSGISVTWGSTNGGSFASNPTTTDGSGVTTVAFTVSNVSGTAHVITAVAGAASGTMTVNAINTAPVAVDQNYDAIGNVTTVIGAPGVLSGASDADGQSLSAVAGTYTTDLNGTFVLSADGSFTYLNAAGFNGKDSVAYVVTDGSLADTAYAYFNVARRFWYVDNSAASPGDGRDSSPFDALSSAQAASFANDTILVKYGNGTSSGMAAGIVLKSGQGLIGQGIASSLTTTVNGNAVTLLAAGNAPTITNTAAGVTVQLAQSNVVRGLSVQSTSGDAVAGASFVTLAASDLSVAAVGGAAFDLSTGSVTANVANASATGGNYGLRLNAVAGNMTIAGGAISATTTAGLSIGSGSATVSYGGSINVAAGRPVEVTGNSNAIVTVSGSVASTGQGISVTGNSGGSVAFTAPGMTLTTGSNNAIDLNSNLTTTAVSFTGGGLTVATTTGEGLRGSSGGTVTVSGAGNTIVAAGGRAVDLVSTAIGAAGVALQSVSANGGSNGIVLDNTGTLGGFTVTGNSAGNCGGDANPSPSGIAPYGTRTVADPTDCSGGTLQNFTGADGSTNGIGVYLNNASNVTLIRVRLTGTQQNYGLRAVTVANLSLDDVLFDGTFGTNASLVEGGVILTNASGSVTVNSTSFSGSLVSDVQVRSTTNVTLNRITFDNVTFNTHTVATSADHLLILNSGHGILNTTIQNSRFMGARSEMVRFSVLASSTADLIMQNNVFFNENATVLSGGGGVALSTGATSSDASTFTYAISGNRFRGSNGAGLAIQNGQGTATSTGTITNNIIGDQAVANSGSAVGNGLIVTHSQRGKSKVLVDNNQVYQYSGISGMYFLAGGTVAAPATTNDGLFNVTARRNVISNPGTNNPGSIVDGLRFDAGSNSGDAYTFCIDAGQGSGNANNIANGGRPAEGGGAFTVIANVPGANPFQKFKGYPLQTDVGSAAEPFVDTTIGSANGGVTGYEELPSSTTTYNSNNAVGKTCDLF